MVVGVQLVVISEEEEEHQLDMEMMMLENDDVLMETRVQSQTKSGLIKLESFKFLRVLLVEFDDSTRSIIAALLRKSGYRVVAVADGFKAWETLQARSHNIDLVLAEVQLPSPLSGFSLLTRIMADDFCRNIPVIMMSSYDAVNVVFKCMLGGAADFLVKPVRKNELRNLWQHVWRRHSATAAHSLPVANPPSQQITEAIDDETSSSEHHSTHSVSPTTTTTTPNQTKDCTQKGTLSHSSCRKPDMKDDIMHIEAMHNLSQLKSRNVSLMKTKEAEPVHLDDVLLMNENEVEDKSARLATEAAPCNQSSHSIALISGEQHADAGIMTRSNNPVTEALREDSNRHTDKYYTQDEQLRPSTEAMDLIGSFDNQLHEYNTRFEEVVPNTTGRNCSSTPRLELSLRRSHSSDSEIQGAIETQTLRHSNASAFSRYNHRTVQPPVCSERKEHVSVSCKHESDHALSQTAEVPKRGVISVPLPVRSTRVDGLYSGCGAAVWPQLFYAPVGPLQLQSSNSVPQQEAVFHVYSSDESNPENYDLEQSNCKSSKTTVYKQQSNVEFLDDSKHVVVATQSVDSSLCNSSSSDINSSGCGSVCDGSNGNETAVTNVGGSSGRGNDVGVIMYDGIRGTDSHCSTQREAALTKFRLKRKDRCFDKKVRYQSRKRLAEQRPRVKGQFVRQISS